VLFTGLDFSYPQGQLHARGAPSHLATLLTCSRIRPCGLTSFETLLERPRLWFTGKNGERLLTDLVLHSYARQMQSINASSNRTYDLGLSGLPVATRWLESLPQLTELLAGYGDDAAGRKRTASAGTGGQKRAGTEVRAFCEQEQALLADSIEKTSMQREKTGRDFRAVEYLLLSLPEVDPDRTLSRRELQRIAAQARVLHTCLQHTADAS
jgi:hypothetical protein